MIYKRLFFLILFAITVSASAQVKRNNYLYSIYKQQDASKIFAGIDAIRSNKKLLIETKVKALPAASKKEILRNADAALTSPWPLLTLGQFNEYKVNGNRVNYENNYFARRAKLTTLIIGELVAGNGKYMQEIASGLGLVLEESTWALPAHMSLQKAGDGLPDVNEPIIDLFVGQTAMMLSYTKYLLHDQLEQYSPLLNKRIDDELNKRVFTPYLSRDDFWWMGFNTTRKMNNWNVFINTNVLATAVFAQDNPKIRQQVIEKTVRSVDNFLKAYPSDGGCDEGPSYWGIAGGALIEYIDLLSVFSNQQLDFSKSELIHQIGTYIFKVHIDGNYYVNFADAAAVTGQDPSRIYKFGKLFNDQDLLGFAAYVRQINNGAENFDLGNIQGFITSLEIRDDFKNLTPAAPQLKRSWLDDVQILTARQFPGSAKGLFFATKGGHNAESHNHNDIGNFIIYKDGTPIVIDAGVGVYTKQTFSPDRYKLWYMQSGWHNCPTINGVMQQQGAAFKATAVTYGNKGELTQLSINLATAYPEEAAVTSWIRNFTFNHEQGKVILKENFALKALKMPSTLNFLVNGKVEFVRNGVLKLTNSQNKTISLIYNPAEFDHELEIKKIDDARLAGSWHNDLTRIVLKRKGNQLKGSHQIEFRD